MVQPTEKKNATPKNSLFFRMMQWIAKKIVKEPEFVWKTDQPDEPAIFVCNHTKIYAPTCLFLYRKEWRMWSNNFFLNKKSCKEHLLNKVLANRSCWLRGLGKMLVPLIVYVYRHIDPIPVYRDQRVVTTFNEAIRTLQEGRHEVIFPERTEGEFRYIYEFNRGFAMMGPLYYKRTGKLLRYYPVYCCQDHERFIVGNSISYDPSLPAKEEPERICRYLENAIRALADAEGPHKVVVYG